MHHVDKRRRGFTLIELMLAMSFISVLLIAIALTVIQISNVYNRGLTMKDVNQAGRSISAELQRAVSQSPSIDIGSDYVAQGDWGGRLCLGQYSYIWNYGKDIVKADLSALNIYDPDISPIRSDIPRFVKVLDPGSTYCRDTSKKIDPNVTTELLNVGEHNLAIHGFTISTAPSATDSRTKQTLYSIEFEIGTNDQDALTLNAGTGCKVPDVQGADPNYCSINVFDLVVRSGSAIE